jgi:hypothetical protein
MLDRARALEIAQIHKHGADFRLELRLRSRPPARSLLRDGMPELALASTRRSQLT